MKRTSYALMALIMLVVFALTACGGSPAPAPVEQQPVQQQPVEQQPVQQQPVQEQPTAQVFAPVCQNAPASCEALDVKDTVASDTDCIKKVPYQYILVPPGTILEPLEPDNLTCKDQNKVVDGKAMFACFGKEGWSSQLKLTNPACGGSSLVTGTGQCQDGYGYDTAQACCAPVTGGSDTGSITITVNMGQCGKEKIDPTPTP